jgi:uncharacterized oligopeptide transporter (OPT) family protein
MSEQVSSAGPVPAAEAEFKLPVEGFKGTPEEIERQWYEKCYTGRGDSMLQLSWRAVIMGSLLGGILSLTNLYMGLKTGWGFGVAITACILSYAIWTTFHKLGLVRTQMTILENNCMQSCASSAGYSTGGTLVSAIAALILVSGHSIPTLALMGWVFFLAVLGVTMAIPMKRQMINVEQLRFPSGTAAAETLSALHSTGAGGNTRARALGIAGLLAAVNKFLQDGIAHLMESFPALGVLHIPDEWAFLGKTWAARTVSFAWSPMFIAAGAITGMRVCVSMLIGGTLCWVVLCPIMVNQGVIQITITEAVPTFPAEVVAQFKDIPTLQRRVAYMDYSGELEWKGPMSPEQREVLLGLSDNLDYRQSVARLYVRSQYRAGEPLVLGAPPEIPAELTSVVHYDAEKRALVADELISPAQYTKLRALSEDPAVGQAIERLYARSSLTSAEPLWVAAELAQRPRGLRVPPPLNLSLDYDEEGKQLLWRGPMSPEQYGAVTALSADPAYREAAAVLQKSASDRRLSVTLPAEGPVQFEAATGRLVVTGPVTDEAATALKALSEDAGYRRALRGLVEASQAERASENYTDLVRWGLWGGASCMVTSALLAFAMQWRSVVRAMAGLGRLIMPRRRGADGDPMEQIETPSSWFIIGQVVGGVGLVVLAYEYFGMPVWQSVVAVLASFFLAIVACRVCGETDSTPVGAMGKITQFMFGAVAPRQPNVNLMAACITAGAADSSSDLLTDLKSGYLLGANPRKQFLAQFAGIFLGTFVSVWSFNLLVQKPSDLGTREFPAPAAQTWAAVARLLNEGFEALDVTVIWAIVIGGAVGIVLPLLEKLFPKHTNWIPSAAGLGLAFTFQWYTALLFFIGALIGWIIEKRRPKLFEDYAFTVASGVIAGESLMGVGVAFWKNGPMIWQQIFG